jgi:hypothetical protein
MRVRVEAEEIIEKKHQASKLDEEALLAKVKILKELEALDLGHIRSLIEMANMLKEPQEQKESKPAVATT